MLPIKKILCPTDFSDPSYEGLKAANELADHHSAELILLYAVTPMPVIPATGALTGFQLPSILKEMEEKAAEMMAHLKAEKVKKDINSRSMVIHGNPTDVIVKTAEEEKADLIVIATHGESGWRRFISGSVTERVVRMASCPVVAIPAPSEE